MVCSFGGSCTVYVCMRVLDIHGGHGNPYSSRTAAVWGVIGGACHVLDRSEDWIGVSSLGWVGKQQRNGQVRFSYDFHWMTVMMMVYYPVYYPQWNLYTYY